MDLLEGQAHRRHNPLLDEWVLVSPGRTQRPWSGAVEATATAELMPYDPACYLCPGNSRANGEVNPTYDGTFVFTNDFAALRPDATTEHFEEGLLRAEGEAGTCRVVCFSPRHDLSLSGMTAAAVRGVIDTWADQTTELGRDYAWVQVFENRGVAMGASNPHPHGQIWAGSAIPVEAARERANQGRYHADHDRPLLADYAAQEAGSPRVVYANTDWLVVVPFWATWPYETLLLPLSSNPARLADLDAVRRDSLVDAMQTLLSRYDALFDTPFPYSMGWHQAPFDDGPTDSWLLHAHYYPPLLRSATVRKHMVGFELLSEPQRDLSPEEAADTLRGPGVRG
jgi:UDPglucose--hexose-1-phosphate uridylyltransferase